MKNLRFRNVWLWSGKEHRARKETLHEKAIIIRGTNSTGKSSFIKSLYYSLGADIDFHPKWVEANVTSVVEVSVDDQHYFFLRQHRLLSVFDAQKNLIFASSTLKDASQFLGDLFNFKLPLIQSSDGKSVRAYPAFQYLPYYLDQDKSWNKTWTAFEKLGQFKNWQRDLIDFHTGIRPALWYQVNEQLAEIKHKLTEKEGERRHILNARKHIENTEPQVLFDIDIESYRAEINRLLLQCEELKIKQEEFRTKLFRLRNRESEIKQQVEIARSSLAVAEKDYHFVSHDLVDPHVDCPMCGTRFENSMISRFSLVEDTESCRSLLVQLDIELRKVRKEEIEPIETKYSDMAKQVEEINQLLSEKRGELSFGDVIKAESQKQIHIVLKTTIDSYTDEIDSLNIENKNLRADKRNLNDIERTKEIKDTYNNLIKRFLFELSVMNLSPTEYEGLPVSISEKGSEQPRALLAYHYAILHTVKKFGKGVFFPIVLDSPNQQDQDADNLKKLLEFPFKECIQDAQVILGTVEMHGAEHDGQDIHFTTPYQMLQVEQYDEVDRFVRPLLDAALIRLAQN